MTTMTKELSSSQLSIATSIIESDERRITLAGLAGTGKTTVSQYVYEQWVRDGLRVIVMAPTGKAAHVLRTKGVPATTIHRVIYHYRGKFIDENDEEQLLFMDNGKMGMADRFIVDEASMVTARQKEDIENRGIPTLWVGDPGQLPPVKSKPTGLFTRPTHVLREIHRQAAGNPVIRWAHALRSGVSLSDTFEGITHIDCAGGGPTFVASKMLDRKIDRLIVKTNLQRVKLNDAYRLLVNRRGVLAVGDEIICCLNNRHLDVVNGEIFTVLEVRRSHTEWTEALIRSLDMGRTLIARIWNDQFGRDKRTEDEVGQQYMLADYAYAITCHKFQGSSAPHIGIAAKGYCGDDDRRWNYTAATRAEDRVTVFC